MKALAAILGQRRLLLSTALFLAALGAFAWHAMPRQEDPTMPEMWALAVTPYPGADAETVERLVLDPIEEELAEVDAIAHINSIARADAAVVSMELHPGMDTEEAWDEVEDALERAARDFPANAGEPSLDHEMPTRSIVLAITGSQDRLALAEGAEELARRLRHLPTVAEAKVEFDPGEQVTIALDEAAARRLGLSPASLQRQLEAATSGVPGGAIRVGGRITSLRPNTELGSAEEIAAIPIVLASGAAVPLGEVATVRRAALEPESSRMRHAGRPAVALGLVPRDGVHVVDFGAAVREELAAAAPSLAPLTVEEVTFQPDRVQARLDDLGASLLLSVLIVAGLLLFFMGPRLGLVVAAIVPLVGLGSLAIYAVGGGVLHQMSIAALVIALGMLVDNAIVVAENVQRRIDEGVPRREAALAAVRELAVPLAAATATTLAAFVPMLMSEGPTAEFTRALPIVIMLSLVVSYVFALVITPTLSAMALRPSRGGNERSDRLSTRLGRFAVDRKFLVLAGTLLLVGSSAAGAGAVGQQFFPASDRNQLLVSLTLPEGAHIEEIDAATRRLEAAFSDQPGVRAVTAFAGRGAPTFYYNVMTQPNSPHLAQVLVTTGTPRDVPPLADFARHFVADELPGVEVVARGLEQGPPVVAPIALRITGAELAELDLAARAVLAEVRAVDGTLDVRHDVGLGVPSMRVAVDDAAATRAGFSRADVGLSLLRQTRGLSAGELRTGADPIPIVLRGAAGEDFAAEAVETLDVVRPGAPPLPLTQLAQTSLSWRPAVIRHRDHLRVVTVNAELASDMPFSVAEAALAPRIAALELPPGVEVAFGGASEGSDKANAAIAMTVPIGIFLLLFILLIEFNSFRRVLIVLLTVPLAAAGIVPGLLLFGQSFGFMSMLGVVALGGIVVNNAIVLLDVTERRREEGASVRDALVDAVRLRTRPILLTTGTTVAGLLPLMMSETTLWPPLASAMISGLLASTVLTLLAVPALYSVLFREKRAGETATA